MGASLRQPFSHARDCVGYENQGLAGALGVHNRTGKTLEANTAHSAS